MLPNKFASMGSGGGGGGGGAASISRPKEIFVTTDGNDSTGTVGDPSKPFLTVNAAIVAGEASGSFYTVMVGTGTFNVSRIANSANRVGFFGVGKHSVLNVQNQSTDVLAAVPFNEFVCNLKAAINTDGFSPSDNLVSATAAASITLKGYGWLAAISAAGGNSYTNSGQPPGAGATITIVGNFSLQSTIYSMDGNDDAGTPATTGGAITADGLSVYPEGTSVTGGDITFGRCSYSLGQLISNGSGGVLTYDKGGNAQW